MKAIGIALIAALVAAATLMVGTIGETEAQEVSTGTCSEYDIYWGQMIAAVPQDTEGQDALIKMLDAGELTRIADEEYIAVAGFLVDWKNNIVAIDPPASSEPFHTSFLDTLDSDIWMIDFYQDEGDVPYFGTVETGLYVMFIFESATPPVCAS